MKISISPNKKHHKIISLDECLKLILQMKQKMSAANDCNSSFMLTLMSFVLILFITFSGYAQTTVLSTTSSFTNNNGSGQVTFNFQNTNGYAVKITDIEGVVGTAGANTCNLWYKTTPLSGSPGAISTANGWNIAMSGTFTGVANTTTTVTQSFISGGSFIVPPGVTYAFSVAVLNQRYFTLSAGTTTISAGGCNLITGTSYGYGGGMPPSTPPNTPRGWIGRITFVPAIKATNDAGVFSIDSPGLFCTPGLLPVKATIKNYGNNQITSLNVNWSVNGILQTPYSFSGLLDTAGGFGSSSIQVPLGSYSFPATPVNMAVWTSGPNSGTDTVALNDSANAVKAASMSGTYTINPSGSGGNNYTTFAAATSDLRSKGVCGPVVFNIAAATYNEQVNVIGPVAGVSSANTITFDGGNGNAATRVVSFNATSTAYQTFSIQGVPYVTVKNLTINALNTSYAFGVLINGNSQYSRLSHCVVNVPAGSSTGLVPLVIGGSITSYSAGGRVDSLLVDSNEFNGGYFSNTWYAASANYSWMNRVIGNSMKNFYQYGMYVYYQNGITISNNRLIGGSTITSNYGIYCPSLNTVTTNPVIITGNRVTNVGLYHLYVSGSNTAANKGQIVNNMFGGGRLYGTSYMMYMTSANYWYVAHNSVLNDFAATTAANYGPLYIASGSGNTIVNNIFASTKSGNLGLPIYLASATNADTMDYNIFYRQDTSNNYLIYVGGYFNSGNFKGGGNAAFNLNSRYINPGFMNDTNLHVSNACNKGMTIPANHTIAYDMDGKARSTPPVIGADEPVQLVTDLAVDRITSPVSPISTGLQDLKVRVKNYGTATITGFTIAYRHNGGTPVTQTWTGTLVACDTITVTFTGANQINLGNANTVMVYTSNPNSSTDQNRNNDTIISGLFTPMSGIYTIGQSGANFNSFTSAISTMQSAGIAGPITFNVNAGTYYGQISIPLITGMSAANPITFDGGYGNASTRIVTGSYSGQSLFVLNQCKYVTVRNLTISNTFSGSCQAVCVVGTGANTAAGNTISNCIINTPYAGTATSYGITTSNTVYGAAVNTVDSLRIDSNNISGSYYGIYIYGNSTTAATWGYNRDFKIRGNNINNIYYYAMYLYYMQSGIDVIGNTITDMNTAAGYYGIYMYYCYNHNATNAPHRIIGNSLSTMAYNYVYYTSATPSNPTQVINNMVFNMKNYSTNYGFYLYNASGYNGEFSVYHNSVNLSQCTTTGYGTYYYNTVGGSATYIQNNIFTITGGSAATYFPLYCSTNPSGNVVNYNNYYNSVNSNLLYRGSALTSATYLSATGGGDSSYNLLPNWISYTNLHLMNGCGPRGLNLSSIIPTDFDGETRSTTPLIGADEYPGTSMDLALTAIASPVFPIAAGLQDLKVRVSNNGSTTISAFNITYRLNGGATVTAMWTGTLPPCGVDSFSFTGTQQINLLSGINTIRVYSDSPNFAVDSNRVNDTITTQLSTPMLGTYIIGSSASDFVSFPAALSALQIRGIGGNVIMNVRTGTYTGKFEIPLIQGVSDTSTITFKSMANNSDSVIVGGNPTDAYLIRLDGSYVNFKLMTLQNLNGVSSNNIINISPGASYDSIVGCKINLPVYPAYTGTNYLVYGTGLNMFTNGIVFKNNITSGSYYGFYVYGTNQTNQFMNFVFDGNTINNSYAYSFYTYYSNGLKFMNNTVNPNSLYSGHIIYFMYTDTVTITGNRFNMTNNFTNYCGYYARGGVNSNRCLVANNIWTGTSGVATATLYWGYQSSQIDFYNNTVHLPSSSQAVYIYNSGAIGQNVKNNIISNTGLGSAAYFSAIPTAAAVSMDYNDYYTSGSTIINGASSQTNLSSWKSVCNCDKNSINYRPGFISALNPLPNPADSGVWAINGRGIHLPDVISDITGAARPATVAAGVPDLGAYEVTPTAIPPMALVTPTVIPSAGTTQYFTMGTDTLAKVYWDPFSTVPSTITMRHYTGLPPSTIGSAINYMNTYWDFNAPGTGFSYTLTLYYKKPWIGTNPVEANIIMTKKSTGVPWTALYSSTIDTTNTLLSVAGLTDFSQFTGTDIAAPLPVEVMNLSGEQMGNDVVLKWQTATEINNSHFEIEKSSDNKLFSMIGKAKGAGNSNELISYTFIDEHVGTTNPTIYYRVKQFDFDGKSTLHGPVVIRINNKVADFNMVSYPNPFTDNLELKVSNDQPGIIHIVVNDVQGKVVNEKSVSIEKGINFITLDNITALKSGFYFVNVTVNGNVYRQKLVKTGK